MPGCGVVGPLTRLVAECGGNKTEASRRSGISESTFRRRLAKESPVQNTYSNESQPVIRLPDPAPEAGGPSLPEPITPDFGPCVIDTPGTVSVISDIHCPYHDKAVLELFFDDCKRHDPTAIVFNGDILDCASISSHFRTPNEARIEQEIECGQQLFQYTRSRFPKARLIWKMGNHEERFLRFLANNVPELFNIKTLTLDKLVEADKYGVEVVADKRIIMLGKLPVLHGHEYQGGGGVMPARWLYLRTGESAMMGHFHQPTFYSFRTLTGKEVGMWSLGCACYLSPAYRPFNQWGHGWAQVQVASDRSYHVHQRRRLKSGQVA